MNSALHEINLKDAFNWIKHNFHLSLVYPRDLFITYICEKKMREQQCWRLGEVTKKDTQVEFICEYIGIYRKHHTFLIITPKW